jgi:hypothetical protein
MKYVAAIILPLGLCAMGLTGLYLHIPYSGVVLAFGLICAIL